ncbi:MAG: amidohydrolase family protein [Spirochaetales bacterium]|nr:amidohydrolase family protein [Spirochaetales bacterium]
MEIKGKPLIDVHEHIFRGRDIPLKGYLYSRKYENLPLVRIFGKFFHFLTPVARCVQYGGRNNKRSLWCKIIFGIATLALGKGYRRWGEIMSLPDIIDVYKELAKDYAKDKVDLFVPLLLDYEYWFKNTYDTCVKNQIDMTCDDVVVPMAGRVHPFVPFCPARELAFRKKMLAPDGSRERYSSLELVKKAINEQGFIGVKLYPALGYRPVGNTEVDKQRRKKIFRHNNMKQYMEFTGKEIDGALDELFRYCEKEQVPITAHCVSGGIEAFHNASYVFGAPRYWDKVLKKYPRLHLNLAHFGWTGKERYNAKGTKGQKPWVKEICEMLEKYGDLYIDSGHHMVTTKSLKKEFIEDWPSIIKDHGNVVKKRFLYGVDWHVFAKEENYKNFKEDYCKILKENNLFSNTDIDDFLGRNAVHFLGLLPKKAKQKDGWNKNRLRLEAFYKKHKIKPPKWFVETGR